MATTSEHGGAAGLPFPPVTKSHIRNTAVPSWHPRYRTSTPKTRLIPLNRPFLDYLRADGIVLPPDGEAGSAADEYSDTRWDEDDADEADDPTKGWEDVHTQIKATIAELGGRVHPKLNWSAPKDATWISATNSMECRSANDIYLLLKSSDFVTHDLQEAYYGCSEAEEESKDEIQYHLVLRKSVASMVTSMEFRCFVRDRRLIGVCQRDLNHYDFMPSLLPVLQDLIYDFFDEKLKNSFPDPNFVFDIYVPQPKDTGRVWLIDINPWAPRTDPLLFSWLELLTMPTPPEPPEEQSLEEAVVRLHLQVNGAPTMVREEHADSGYNTNSGTEDEADYDIDDEDDTPLHYPSFRLVKRDDPEAYSFNSPLYSAHKIPKDVVDASMTMTGEGGMREFMQNWQQKVADLENGKAQESSDEE